MFKNFINYHNNKAIINKQKLKLVKIIINNMPSLRINPFFTLDHTINIKIAL